jgi:hypothetical protein
VTGYNQDERNWAMWREWITGTTQAAIGRRYGLTQSRVSEILRELQQSMPKPTRDELIAREAAFLDDLRRQVMDLTAREGAPVTAGKDGMVVRDPESGEVVRDYSLRLAAAREGRELNKRLATLLGLDAAQRVDVTVIAASAEAEQAAAEAAAYLAEGGQTG